MLTKVGVNTTRAQKSGPVLKEGASTYTGTGKFKKICKCSSCGAKLEKSCSNEMVCEITTLKCPKCGSDVL